jgi:hypothetical protein
MKIRLLITIIGLLIFNLTFGQNQEKYSEFVIEAWKHYESKDYKKSADKYIEAFDQIEGKAYPNDRFNAACSYALAKNIDTSFYHLFRLANDSDYKDYEHITTITDLDILHNDKRWKELVSIVKSNKEKAEKAEKNLDKSLVTILNSIFKEDQSYRRQIREIEKTYGTDSEEVKAQWETINEKDSINLIVIKNILDKRGWLGANIIGELGNITLFAVIQHSDLETQVKYLPMMREAVKKGNADASSLAMLEDRVAVRQGNRQIYGSQIAADQDTGEYYVSPLIDPENVDKRRAEVGLGTLSDYVSRYNMIWDIKKHKEQTAKTELEEEE